MATEVFSGVLAYLDVYEHTRLYMVGNKNLEKKLIESTESFTSSLRAGASLPPFLLQLTRLYELSLTASPSSASWECIMNLKWAQLPQSLQKIRIHGANAISTLSLEPPGATPVNTSAASTSAQIDPLHSASSSSSADTQKTSANSLPRICFPLFERFTRLKHLELDSSQCADATKELTGELFWMEFSKSLPRSLVHLSVSPSYFTRACTSYLPPSLSYLSCSLSKPTGTALPDLGIDVQIGSHLPKNGETPRPALPASLTALIFVELADPDFIAEQIPLLPNLKHYQGPQLKRLPSSPLSLRLHTGGSPLAVLLKTKLEDADIFNPEMRLERLRLALLTPIDSCLKMAETDQKSIISNAKMIYNASISLANISLLPKTLTKLTITVSESRGMDTPNGTLWPHMPSLLSLCVFSSSSLSFKNAFPNLEMFTGNLPSIEEMLNLPSTITNLSLLNVTQTPIDFRHLTQLRSFSAHALAPHDLGPMLPSSITSLSVSNLNRVLFDYTPDYPDNDGDFPVLDIGPPLDLAELSCLPNLETLHIGSKVADITTIQALGARANKLKFLTLRPLPKTCFDAEIVFPLLPRSLVSLSLRNCSDITPSAILKLPKFLTSLSLFAGDRSYIPIETWCHFPKLRMLDMHQQKGRSGSPVAPAPCDFSKVKLPRFVSFGTEDIDSCRTIDLWKQLLKQEAREHMYWKP